jgi:hypothetical protein
MTYSREDLGSVRAAEQVYFEDSASVFFASFANPMPDRDFLWFASFLEGAVRLDIHNVETDSLEAVFTFADQDIPLYTLAQHRENERKVKCVLFVDGRVKCATIVAAWSPIQVPQWKTQYTVHH